MQMFLLGFGLLLFMGVWHFMLRKTILDHYRDKLFDLRDELRTTYVRQGWDLNSPLYARLRHLANGYLRSTEVFSFIPHLFLEIWVQANPALVNAMKAELERQFGVQDEVLKRFVAGYRRRALDIMLGYMISGSISVLLLFCVLVPIATTCALLRSLHRDAFGWSRRPVAEWVFKVDLVEDYSYRLGMQSGDSGNYRPVA